MEQALSYAIKEGLGLFAVLFVALLWWVLRTNDEREKRYQGLVDRVVGDLGGRLAEVEKGMEALPSKVAESIRLEAKAWRD